MTESCSLPVFEDDEAGVIAKELFGLDGRVTRLPGERDLNFLIKSGDQSAVLKIANVEESREILKFQHEVFERIRTTDMSFQSPVSIFSCSGDVIETVEAKDGRHHLVRTVSWLDGYFSSTINPQPLYLSEQIGAALGCMDKALAGFSNCALKRPLLWNIENAVETINRFLSCIEIPEDRNLVIVFRDRFEQCVMPYAHQLRHGVIHNDANGDNIVLSGEDPWNIQVTGIIDFGDMVDCWVAAEPAIAAAYAILGSDHILNTAASVVRGYYSKFQLSEQEISVLFELMCIRLSLSVCVCAYQKSLQPKNEYLRVSEQAAWKTLQELAKIQPDFAHYSLRAACGLEPVPASLRIISWLSNQSANIRQLTDVDFSSDSLLILDSSVGSSYMPGPSQPLNPAIAAMEISRLTADCGCVAAIGLYGEYRLIYSSDDFVDVAGCRRTLHLGIDIFMPACSAVYAPLAGTVLSITNYNQSQDYGGILILEHELEDKQGRLVFYTLYGHLKPDSMAGIRRGDAVCAGDKVAEMGDIHENGNWPEHVHFQIITDLLDNTDTFPGVGTHQDRAVWLSLCPDPNIILGIPDSSLRTGLTHPEKRKAEIARQRSRQISPSLSLLYHDPIELVRADMQYMYDYTGRRYLDAVNNVAHVGHCHPRVVEAACGQMRVLNTNTRYLYAQVTEFTEKLLNTFPDSLQVCFLVNSGSEANDLAMRLAMNHTGNYAKIILDHAYHGNLASLIEISPYKHNAQGGSGPPDNVHTISLPTSCRRVRTEDELSSTLSSLDCAIEDALKQGGPALFIAESILGCAGQVVLPDGYLKDIYGRIRDAGGICIADEVQTGLGRVGSHFWAFETQQVIPDIVTVGKPLGNGHPLSAVVTTWDIAETFNNGMEYFNTFGGNPVSCAVGSAVLDVVREDGLQANAFGMGAYLQQRLCLLMDKHPVIGEVRGMGLFLGVELINSQQSPAANQAKYIVERMRQKDVLLSTDGPFHNVIKIKPPMCFNQDNADELVSKLDAILGETFAKYA